MAARDAGVPPALQPQHRPRRYYGRAETLRDRARGSVRQFHDGLPGGRRGRDGRWLVEDDTRGSGMPAPALRDEFPEMPGGQTLAFRLVRDEESRDTLPIISSVSPVIGAFDGSAFAAAITGLHGEASGHNNPAALHQWCDLVHHYVMRFAEPSHLDERLWRLWSRVEKEPARHWTLRDFSEIACLSSEHLRRLCLKEIGRSPMRHLTFIRLQLALRLLSSTDEKIETIARFVGFGSIHSFSNSFKGRFGRPPSDFR